MSSYHTSYPPSSPSLSDPIGASTLPSNDQPGPYLNSQLDIPSPAYTSSARVSKAMKGKRVHACEYPGCDKVFTRAEHRRRHELSHEPRKQYPCTFKGCEKAFHRADYWNQHIARHGQPKSRVSHAYKIAPRRSSIKKELPQPQKPLLMPSFSQVESTNYSSTWGSMDSSISYSQSSRAPSLSPVSEEHHSPYSYASEICSSPLPSDSYMNPEYPASGIPVEMVTAIDQYLRSILKPEAFTVSQQPIDPTDWTPDLEIDPSLTKMESQEQLPLYSWPPVQSLPYDDSMSQMSQSRHSSH